MNDTDVIQALGKLVLFILIIVMWGGYYLISVAIFGVSLLTVGGFLTLIGMIGLFCIFAIITVLILAVLLEA